MAPKDIDIYIRHLALTLTTDVSISWGEGQMTCKFPVVAYIEPRDSALLSWHHSERIGKDWETPEPANAARM